MRLPLIAFALACVGVARAGEPPQQMADFGRCRLRDGSIIEPCRMGYRVAGALSGDGRQVIIVPSWFTGTSKAWFSFAGPHQGVDLGAYTVVVIDALGNGVSSSPSNSPKQRQRSFPTFTLADSVAIAHRVAVEKLGLRHVRAVVGVSMGAMQALQWAADFPEFMDGVVAIAGTPKPTAHDVRPWRRELEAHHLPFAGPKRDDWLGDDALYQLWAMAHHDIAAGRALEDLVPTFTPRLLVVGNHYDELVSFFPSLVLARLVGGVAVEMHSPCGHIAPMLCEKRRTREAVSDFLQGL